MREDSQEVTALKAEITALENRLHMAEEECGRLRQRAVDAENRVAELEAQLAAAQRA